MREWPGESRRRFADLVAGATAVVQFERRAPETTQRAGQAMDRRNAWFRQVADEALIVWDGSERRVGDVVRKFEQDLPDDVWVIAP